MTKQQNTNVSSNEFVSVDPCLFGYKLDDVDTVWRGGIYAIRPSKTGINPQTGFPTHGVYYLLKIEIMDGDFAGETQTRSYYVGGLGGSIPKGSPPRPLLIPSADNKTPVGGLSSEDIVALAIGTATFEESEYSKYEGKYLLIPKGGSASLRGDSQYGQLVDSVKRLYPVGKNGTPQQIAYGTTFPGILENKGPDFATGYGFHMRLESRDGDDNFKTLVAVSALGPIAATEASANVNSAVAPVVTVASVPVIGEINASTVKPMIYKAIMTGGPANKNELITRLMNSPEVADKNALVAILIGNDMNVWNSDLWQIGEDGRYSLK